MDCLQLDIVYPVNWMGKLLTIPPAWPATCWLCTVAPGVACWIGNGQDWPGKGHENCWSEPACYSRLEFIEDCGRNRLDEVFASR